MAHACFLCGKPCNCEAEMEDYVDSKTENCDGCGCNEEEDLFEGDEEVIYNNCPICGIEYDAIDREYQICSHCKSEQQQGTGTE